MTNARGGGSRSSPKVQKQNTLRRITRGYDLFGVSYLAWCMLRTRISLPRARLIRRPFQLRNLGTFSGAEGLTVGQNCRFDIHSGGQLHIGSDVQINDQCQIAVAERVEIGDEVLIASKVFITDHDHDFASEVGLISPPTHWPLLSFPTFIGARCWLGNGVSILKGVTIGDESIVAAGSVVTRSFPARSVLAGIPAKCVRRREDISKM